MNPLKDQGGDGEDPYALTDSDASTVVPSDVTTSESSGSASGSSSVSSSQPSSARNPLEELNQEALVALRDSLKEKVLKEKEDMAKMTANNEKIIKAYDKTIDELMDRTEAQRGENAKLSAKEKDLITQRDQAMQDLRNVERAFSDVHCKYERAKTTCENLKTNEDTLKERDEQLQAAIYAREQKFEALKEETQRVLVKMYEDFQGKTNALECENSKLSAQWRRSEMRAETLKSELEHKRKENADLNKLADDLIEKKGEY